jgi:hypothetical protein
MKAGPGSPVGHPSVSKGREIAFTVLSFVFGAGALGGLFGIGIVIGWFDNDEGGVHRVHELGFGVLYGIIVATAFFAMMRRPASKPSVFLQVIVVALAVAIAALVSADSGYVAISGALLIASAILFALHPDRAGILRPRPDPSPVLAVFTLLAAIPLVSFGLTSARLQRDGSPLDPHVNMAHWTTMAAMAFGLVAVGLLASVRIPGWRLTAWCAGLGAAAYGLGSIVFRRFPGTSVPYAGSRGLGWGLVAVIGGFAFITIAEWEIRRARPGVTGR